MHTVTLSEEAYQAVVRALDLPNWPKSELASELIKAFSEPSAQD